MRTKMATWTLTSAGARAALGGALALAIAAPAAAGTFYSWKTEDGVWSYTDDPKRIPARYRGAASQRETGSLDGYERYTPVVESAARQARPLPEVSSAPPTVRTAPTVERTTTVVDMRRPGPRARLQLPEIAVDLSGLPSDEPVTVEEVRTRVRGSDATRTVRVVRQGDKVLAVVVPQPNQQSPSFRPYLEDLLE